MLARYASFFHGLRAAPPVVRAGRMSVKTFAGQAAPLETQRRIPMTAGEAMRVLEARLKDIELRYRDAKEEERVAHVDVVETERELHALAKALDALKAMPEP